jgi:hypothetical protein
VALRFPGRLVGLGLVLPALPVGRPKPGLIGIDRPGDDPAGTGWRGAATLSRGRTVYAAGLRLTVAEGTSKLLLSASPRIAAGRYTLILTLRSGGDASASATR